MLYIALPIGVDNLEDEKNSSWLDNDLNNDQDNMQDSKQDNKSNKKIHKLKV